MEYRTLERSIEIEASPETVFEVITSPEHLKEWWADDVELDPRPGGTGRLVFGEPGSPDAHVPQMTVVDADPPRLFSFRWSHPEGESAREGNSFFVTFELSPTDAGTRLRMTETGFREQGWELAVLEEAYRDHEAAWDHFLRRLVEYAPTVESAS